MAEPLLSNPDPDAPALVGGEYGAPAFQSVEQPSGERTVGNVPRATMVQPAPLPSDFGVFHDLVPNEPPSVGGIDFGTFSDLVPRRPPPPPSMTPESDAVVAATDQFIPSMQSAKTGVYRTPSGVTASAYPTTPDQIAAMQEPMIKNVPIQINPNDPWYKKTADAASNTVAGFVSGMSSGAGLLQLIPPIGLASVAGTVPELVNKVQEAEKTPAGSAERYQAGTDVLGYMATLGLMAHGAKGAIERPTLLEADQIRAQQAAKAQAIAQMRAEADAAARGENVPFGTANRPVVMPPREPPTGPEPPVAPVPVEPGPGPQPLGGAGSAAVTEPIIQAEPVEAVSPVRHGEFGQEGYTAVEPAAEQPPTVAEPAPAAPAGEAKAAPPIEARYNLVEVDHPTSGRSYSPIPPPVEGHTRLYRWEPLDPSHPGLAKYSEGIPSLPEHRGGWWFEDIKNARMLGGGAPGGYKIVSRDIPNAALEQYRVSNQPEIAKHSYMPDEEFFIPETKAAEAPPRVAEPPQVGETAQGALDTINKWFGYDIPLTNKPSAADFATGKIKSGFGMSDPNARHIAVDDTMTPQQQVWVAAHEAFHKIALVDHKGLASAALEDFKGKNLVPDFLKDKGRRTPRTKPEQFNNEWLADNFANWFAGKQGIKVPAVDPRLVEFFEANREPAKPQPRVSEPPLGGETKYMHPSERPEVPKITEVPPERVPPEPESNDWTTATEPIEKQAGKLKLKADKEGGFVDLSGVADVGRRIYERGVDFARWSAEMIRHLGEKIKPHLQAVWDSLTGKNMLPGTGESGGIGKTGRRKAAFGAKLLPGYSELDALTGKRSAKLQKSTADVERITKEFKKVAKTPKVENAMSAWAEAQGDLGVLKQQEGLAKGKMMKQAARDAQKLTPEQQALALKGRQTFDIMGKRVAHYGMLNNFRQNYVPHLFDVGMRLTGVGSAKLQSKFKFAKAAKYQSFFEADQAGLKPKTMEMGKLLGLYTEHANQLIADRQFVQGAQTARSEAGEPLLAARGRAGAVTNDAGGKAVLVNPHSLKKGLTDLKGNPVDQSKYTVDTQQPALRDWQFSGKDTAGNPIFSEDDLAMHPEFAKRLRAMTGRSRIRMLYDQPGGFAGGPVAFGRAVLKHIDTAQAVMKREMFGLLAPFHLVQEGTHAIGHTVNPLFNLPKMDKLTPAMVDAAEHGLMLKSERGSTAAAMEGVGGKGQFTAQIARKFGGRIGRKIADVLDGSQDWLFEHYIPGLKFKTYEHMLPRNMKTYAKELASGEVTPGDVKMLTAQQANAAYGKLNLALLDRSPTLQHIMQLTMIAPDFLEARGKFVGQAAKSFMGSKAGQEQLRAIAVLAMTQAGTAYVITKALGGEWDPKKPFEVQNADGTRSYFMRSVPEDFARLVLQGTDKRREFVSARINPLVNTAYQIGVSGRNYRGEKITTPESLWELANNYVPIIARSFPGVRELTKTSRDSPISPLERLMGSLGLKVNRTSPITKTYTMAHDWKTAQGIPADTGTYPVSKYQQMRYALEDNNQEKAAGEFQKLLDAAGGDRKKVLAGFHESLNHPFTESMAMDKKFRDSLDGPSRAIYDAAKDRRHEIMRRFNEMKALEVRAVSR